jgi:hypothetical protein
MKKKILILLHPKSREHGTAGEDEAMEIAVRASIVPVQGIELQRDLLAEVHHFRRSLHL